MNKDETENLILGRMQEWAMTGSRVINPRGPHNDTDYICLTDVSLDDLLVEFPMCVRKECNIGDDVDIEDGPTKYAFSVLHLSESSVDFILTESLEFFDKFCLATRVCTALILADRVDRVVVFQALLYAHG